MAAWAEFSAMGSSKNEMLPERFLKGVNCTEKKVFASPRQDIVTTYQKDGQQGNRP
jgi:hypothetical protein